MIDKTVVIVGGGPAGASCAWRLGLEGIAPLILDKKRFPRQKLCAGWVSPSVFRMLRTDPGKYPYGILALKRLVFFFSGRRLPVRTLQYSIRRYEFDRWLLGMSGADFEQHEVKTIRRENGCYVVDGAYRARYIVGAGGTHCPVYRTFFSRLSPRPEEARISAAEEEFRCRDRESDCFLWFFENGLPGYAWYVPKAGGCLNVGIGGRDVSIKRQGKTINCYWRLFERKLVEKGLVPEREFNPKGHIYYINRGVPKLQCGRAYIAGDAAGLATSDMGEGIAPAVRSGIRAAEAIIHQKPLRMPFTSKYSWPGILMPRLRL